MMRRLVIGAVVAAAALAALIRFELALLARREYLPSDPGYLVDTTLEPPVATSHVAVRIAVLGDSTVAGVGSPSEAESLPALIGRRVADATGRRVRVVGYGVSGARTATLTSDQLPRVEAAYDAIIFVIGSNDATHATPWWRFREQTTAMLEGARRLGAPVILAGTPRFRGTEIIPEPLRTMVDRYSGVLRRQQRAAAARVRGVSFVDLAADASPRFAGVPEATSSDGFHPSPTGYGFWADAISPSVVAALGRGG